MTLAGIHHSKGTDNWGTPIEFFERVNKRFNFRLDACAESWNTKCDNFYSQNENGLIKPWTSWTWCNPPYSEIYKWYKKAYQEMVQGNSSVLLTFARTDTRAFHEFAIGATEICFLKGRLRFIDPKTGQQGNTAPSPSMLVIFDANDRDELATFSFMDARLNLRGG